MPPRFDDTIRGTEGDDELSGAIGPEQVFGLGGGDEIFADAGADLVSGGAGDDEIYADPDDIGYPPDDDSVSGDAGDDKIDGGFGADSFDGGDGNDTIGVENYLVVDEGVDTLDGGAGVDTLDLDYYGLSVEVVFGAEPFVEVEGGQYLVARSFERLDFYSARDVAVRVTGGELGDRIRTSGGDDVVAGGVGDDVIDVSDGVDTVDAGAGDDVVAAIGDGPDSVTLGEGDDQLLVTAWDDADEGAAPTTGGRYDGGAGADALYVGLVDVPLSRLVFDGRSLTADGVSLGRFVSFESVVIEVDGGTALEVSALAGDDVVAGSARDDLIRGRDGDDMIGYSAPGQAGVNSVGRDTLDGGAGSDSIAVRIDGRADVIDGGEGDDLLDLAAAAGVIVMTGDLAAGATLTLDGKAVGAIAGVELLRMVGLGRSATLLGGSGADTIEASAGAYGIKTATGDDSLSLTLDDARDRIDLGRGTDSVALFAYAPKSVVMTGEIDDFVVARNGRVASAIKGADSLSIITGDGDDSLFGGALDDTFRVSRGDDTVRAGGGDDLIALSLGDGLDVIDGGDGDDRLEVVALSADERIAFVSKGAGFEIRVGKATVATATSIESVSLSAGAADDRLYGRGGDDSFSGGAGDDRLIGRGGDDTLLGGDGVDTLLGGDGDDRLQVASGFVGGPDAPRDFASLDGGAGVDTVDFGFVNGNVSFVLKPRAVFRIDGETAGSVTGVENVTGGRGDDVLTGDRNANVMSGGEGDDTLDGGRGVDTLDYGDPTIIRGDDGDFGLFVRLNGSDQGEADAGRAGFDVIRNFENVIGSRLDDRIIGDAKGNVIEGGAGADTLEGGAGRDVFLYRETAAGAADLIDDFSRADRDRLDFSRIDVDAAKDGRQALVFVGDVDFSGERAEILVIANGTGSFVYADLDGDGAADVTIELKDATALSGADFLL